MIREWLKSYAPGSFEETRNALREILQEITLAGLYRGGFFNHAAFYGGSALRIFYDLPRFSEDLDFTLLKKDPDFNMAPYLESIEKEFASYGLSLDIQKKEKSFDAQVDSAFLKTETIWRELELDIRYPQLSGGSIPSMKIKVEVDILPPLDFECEPKLLLKPFSFYVNTLTLPHLFSGKMHAILFRKWKNRVKGRDWYDLEWYIRKNVAVNLGHFAIRSLESGDIDDKEINCEQLKSLLLARIDQLDMDQLLADVIRFLPPDQTTTEIWSREYFKDLVGHLECV